MMSHLNINEPMIINYTMPIIIEEKEAIEAAAKTAKDIVQRKTNVTVGAPIITINNTTDTVKAINQAVGQMDAKLQRHFSNAVSNADNGVAH